MRPGGSTARKEGSPGSFDVDLGQGPLSRLEPEGAVWHGGVGVGDVHAGGQIGLKLHVHGLAIDMQLHADGPQIRFKRWL